VAERFCEEEESRRTMSKNDNLPRPWTVSDSLETYGLKYWGGGYFAADDRGDFSVTPTKNPDQRVNLKELVDEVRQRGIGLPVLIRFSDILKTRIVELNEAFRTAIGEYGYKSVYKGVYPIKVNQDRFVVEEIVEFGRPYNYGLEAGSKPELLAVLAMLQDENALVICNGYKDEEYIETALIGSKLGRTIILVVEKASELPLIARVAKRTGIKPRIGIRAKLSSRGSGKWEASGGDRSKFGLSSRDMLDAVRFLRENEMLDCFELLHFHLGSQISAIRSVKDGLREACRFYTELSKAGVPLKYLDVGGGLGIDYDGSQSNFSSSTNYTMQEYANDIVFGVMNICDEAGVPHPTLVSESGRAVVAHHSVLVLDVLGVSEFGDFGKLPEKMPKGSKGPAAKMFDNFKELSRKNILESYHDALEYKEECLQLFNLGHLRMEERVLVEDFFWATCFKILKMVREMDEVPEELMGLERQLSDTYFCNFSMFQSVPDSWAVDQLFPIIPFTA
jgi:arginine decarboxylase